jgi:hypothetical protein
MRQPQRQCAAGKKSEGFNLQTDRGLLNLNQHARCSRSFISVPRSFFLIWNHVDLLLLNLFGSAKLRTLLKFRVNPNPLPTPA